MRRMFMCFAIAFAVGCSGGGKGADVGADVAGGGGGVSGDASPMSRPHPGPCRSADDSEWLYYEDGRLVTKVSLNDGNKSYVDEYTYDDEGRFAAIDAYICMDSPVSRDRETVRDFVVSSCKGATGTHTRTEFTYTDNGTVDTATNYTYTLSNNKQESSEVHFEYDGDRLERAVEDGTEESTYSFSQSDGSVEFAVERSDIKDTTYKLSTDAPRVRPPLCALAVPIQSELAAHCQQIQSTGRGLSHKTPDGEYTYDDDGLLSSSPDESWEYDCHK